MFTKLNYSKFYHNIIGSNFKILGLLKILELVLTFLNNVFVGQTKIIWSNQSLSKPSLRQYLVDLIGIVTFTRRVISGYDIYTVCGYGVL